MKGVSYRVGHYKNKTEQQIPRCARDDMRDGRD
jgi:hypothetical protein